MWGRAWRPRLRLWVSARRSASATRTSSRGASDSVWLLVSHNLAVVAYMCDRLAVMNRGVVVEEMDVTALRQGEPREAYTRQLLLASRGYDAEVAARMVTFD